MAGLVVVGLVGLVTLVLAADQLVVGSGRLAARWRVSPVVVGVVVIGVGTSAPEFVVSGVAAASGRSDLAAANLVGSNMINLTLILGTAALISPVAVRSSVLRREAPLTVLSTGLFAAALLAGLGRSSGAVLAVAAVMALALLVRLSTDPDADLDDAPSRPGGSSDTLPAQVAEFLAEEGAEPLAGRTVTDPRPPARWDGARAALGLVGTLLGAQLLVSSAADVASRLGVSQSVVGFTVVALGTSLPELVTAVQAQRRRASDLLVGNLLGSNLFNSLIGGALVGLAGSGAVAYPGYPVLAAMMSVTLLTWLVLYRGYRVSRFEAVLLLAAYILSLPLVV